MKIVMLCDLYDERAHYQENLLGKYYAKHGHTVTVIASTYNDAISFYADQYDPRASAREFLDGLVKVIKLPYSLNILNKLKRFSGVSELLERAQPDLIYIHDIHLNLAEAARYKRAHPGCRIIMDFHADYTNSAKNWMSLNILHRVIRRAILSKDRKYIDKIYAVVPNSA
jgi:1,2-diacylglycerol 3-alpha-glucosyltransferase